MYKRQVTGLPQRSDLAQYFTCGPEAMMDTVQDVLRRLGVPDERVHQERFTSSADAAPGAAEPQQMVLEKDGRPVGTAVVEPGQTLLDAGLAAGLPMPYSCTVGTCGECVVRLRSGDVTRPEHTCLTPQQKAEGHVLACVSCPLSDVTLDMGDMGDPTAADGARPH